MIPRERVRRAINFEGPDRCPVLHMWLLGSFREYRGRLEELYERYPADIVDVGFVSRQWGELDQVGEFVDEWGILWSKASPNWFGQPVKGPLQELEDLTRYHEHLEVPDAMAAWRFDDAEIKEVIETNPDRFIRAYAGNLFELLQWLRGPSNLWMDIYDESREHMLLELIDRITEYNLHTIERWDGYPVDGIWFMDDWGTNAQLFVHPEKWRKFFKPAYRRMIGAIHRIGRPAEMHTDGYILDVIPDLIEIGLDVLNPQHNLMGNLRVRELCWGKICVRSDVDCQKVLPHGTPEEVSAHVREIIDCFKHPDGGLILHGEVELGVPFENYEAMYKSFAEYGGYQR